MAKINGEQALGIEQVCRVLVRRGFISREQAEKVLSRQMDIRRRLEKARSMKSPSHLSSLKWAEPITGGDIILRTVKETYHPPGTTSGYEGSGHKIGHGHIARERSQKIAGRKDHI